MCIYIYICVICIEFYRFHDILYNIQYGICCCPISFSQRTVHVVFSQKLHPVQRCRSNGTWISGQARKLGQSPAAQHHQSQSAAVYQRPAAGGVCVMLYLATLYGKKWEHGDLLELGVRHASFFEKNPVWSLTLAKNCLMLRGRGKGWK